MSLERWTAQCASDPRALRTEKAVSLRGKSAQDAHYESLKGTFLNQHHYER
ncbi:hypothetical protein BLA15816_04235 [Burkholderia lata]|nr:hypothetical protein BLA15816_04235 [Burkholderia lata]